MNQYLLRENLPQTTEGEMDTYPELLRDLLRARGIMSREQAEQFLNPDYDRDNHHPYRMKDMERAVERVLKAISEKQKIIIYSDYDADGIPGAVVLHDIFKKIGYENFENYIPHRIDEGFGIHVDAIEEFAKSGAGLVISIDCGITDVVAVKRASELGLDVIITDHHEAGSEIPPAYAILNPKQVDCQYPEKTLCGSGVIFKFVQGLIYTMRQRDMIKDVRYGWEKWLLDMVGLATLSDMVPLVGENRVFAYYGLKVLRISPRVGLLKLLRTVKTNQRHISEDDIGFMISPRINAASRMGVPLDAFKLLSTRDEVEAGVLSEHLNSINDERKGIVASMVKEIKKILTHRVENGTMKKVVVIGNPDWRPSLLGLAANTLKDDYGVTVFLWGREGGSTIKGSCRSDGRVSVVELMEATKDSFTHFGGHKMSGGFAVSHEKIHTLEDEILSAYEKIMAGDKGREIEKIVIDKKLTIGDVNWNTYKMIEKLAPFGVGNPKPLFLFEQVEIKEAKLFGKEKNHLELRFAHPQGKSVPAICFFASVHYRESLVAGMKINLVATFEKSMFKNYPELRLRVVDIIV
ncbi:MAG: single-stranded-DNA-specific exonuclease RecJ [Candidatus Paceibacterota bacterium]